MIYGGHSIRAFRPSMVAQEEQYEQDVDQVKEANLRIYEERVRAGLPLFETGSIAGSRGADRTLAG